MPSSLTGIPYSRGVPDSVLFSLTWLDGALVLGNLGSCWYREEARWRAVGAGVGRKVNITRKINYNQTLNSKLSHHLECRTLKTDYDTITEEKWFQMQSELLEN